MISEEEVSVKEILFTEFKSDQYVPRYKPKSALNPENASLRFHSLVRKLLHSVTSVSVITIVIGGKRRAKWH